MNTVSYLRYPIVKSIAWYVNPKNIIINFKLRLKNLRKLTNFEKIFSNNENDSHVCIKYKMFNI